MSKTIKNINSKKINKSDESDKIIELKNSDELEKESKDLVIKSNNVKITKTTKKKSTDKINEDIELEKNAVQNPIETITDKNTLIKKEKKNKSKKANLKANDETCNNIIDQKIFEYEKENEYLSNFLAKNKTLSGYKRITISPLRYAGGKSKAVCLILDNLPKLREKKIVSVFFGGGSFELCASQQLGINVIGYDIFGILTNFWNVLINNKEKFLEELKKFKITTDEFTKNRHILLSYWDKVKPKDLEYKTMKEYKLTDSEKNLLDNDKILQAVYYYYNMTLSYGPMFLGWPSSNEIKPDKFARRIDKLEKMNLQNLSVENLDFVRSIKKHPNDFLFLDPPYYLGKDSKMFKGMYPNCNFAIHHNGFEHDKLCEMLKEHKGGFLLTYNDCDTIRDMYKDYKQIFPKWQYTYGQGETRIGVNRENGNETNIKESHEIFIICPPLI